MQAPRLRFACVPWLNTVTEFIWENMQVLHLTNVTSLTEVAELLAECPNLTELYLDGKDVYWNPEDLPDTLLAQNLKVLLRRDI